MLQRTLRKPRNLQSLSRELKLRFVMLQCTLWKPRNLQSLSRELKLRFVMLQRTLWKPRKPQSLSRELKLRCVMLQRTLRKPRNLQSLSRELKLRSARRVNPALQWAGISPWSRRATYGERPLWRGLKEAISKLCDAAASYSRRANNKAQKK